MFKVFLFQVFLFIFTCYSVAGNSIFALLKNDAVNNINATERIFVEQKGFSQHGKFSPE